MNSVHEIQVWLKSDKNNGHLYEGLLAFILTRRCLRGTLKKYGRARSAKGAVYDLNAAWRHADAI